MLNSKNFEYDCTQKCQLKRHANAITAALTKRSIDDNSLATFVAKTCCNFADTVDDLGRSAVHVSASVNRHDLLEWLLNCGAIISGRDYESGSTPLHRAIFYGCIDCAVLLMRYGASIEVLDEDTRTPLQQACRLCDYDKKLKVLPCNELLVWGSNKNYNLGVNNDQNSDQLPQMLEYFRKEQVSIQSVTLGTYHSLFLDQKSNVYAVGHGKGGRLGIGNENSLSTPKKIKLNFKIPKEEVVGISVSRYHSLLLTNCSTVLACGLNQDSQLGVRDAGEKLLNFKIVLSSKGFGVENLKKVIAKDQHSLAYSDECLYIWGRNFGQMGIEENIKTVEVPRKMKLPPKTQIQLVDSNNNATVVVTKENTILLFHNYKMRVLKAPNYENLKSVAVAEGDTTKSEKGRVSGLKLLILTQNNVIFLWYHLTQNFYRCSFSGIRLRQIDKILYSASNVLILSQGDVYRGKCQQVSLPPYYNNSDSSKDNRNVWSRSEYRTTEISKDFMIRIEIQQIIQIDRAVDIFCDDDFASFAALQESFLKYFKVPTLNPEEYSFKKLYHDVSEYDAVHDIVFHVDDEKFPAHKLLIYARAGGLRDIISSQDDKIVHLNMPLLTSKMFEIMLKFIYTNYLPNEEDIQDIQSSLHTDAPEELENVCKLFLNWVEQFRISNLANYLKSYMQQQSIFYLPHIPDKSKYRFNRLKHTDYPDLYDVRIVCENNVELPAHKCVLVARLEYFEMMFTHAWSEQTTINLTTVPHEYMQAIVAFLYSLDVEHFRKQQYRESFLYNMIVFCDQFFIERLRKVCEILLLDKITIRKCGEMLDFAIMYNCEVMQKGCLDFICQNIARVLLQKSLHNCEPEVIRRVSDHYRKMFKNVFDYRMITPDSEAIDDDCLKSFIVDSQVDLCYRMSEEEQSQYCALNKSKSKEYKAKQNATRQYEREAISAMVEKLTIANAADEQKNEEMSKNLKETAFIANKLQTEAQSWMKVQDKKDVKKRVSLEQALNTNNILRQEEAATNAFINLSKSAEMSNAFTSKTPEKELAHESVFSSGTTPKTYNLNLSDLTTPPREKMSQKQRKRLSSESTGSISWRSPPIAVETKPVTATQIKNAWATLPPSSVNSADNMYDIATGSSQDSSSFANMIKAKKTNSNTISSPSGTSNFSQILAEEKRQKEHYERVRNKSLALTQIEEQAIAELRDFYNVDNIADEIITIERKSEPTNYNFSTWQRN